ncbi:type II secretion system F family protein [Microbacterium marinilacus]|uniref:Type II secretion system F family protein n=1 Tax=Microbacterium marinilacus TaxID=415209 RepID=A0ABP7B507_9MICO|nr:type II secretion system F family protein [Microbacterium marinilacus]MBY0687862.1 type II secretion system F family protein [Microbacterium marinilacus]
MTWATDAAVAVLLGGSLGAGVCLLLVLVPRIGAPSLSRRIAPYIREATDPAGTTAWNLLGRAGSAALEWSVVFARATRGAARVLGTSEGLMTRLAQAGRPADPALFRARQLAWGVAGAAAGALAVVVLALAGAFTSPSLLLPLAGGVGAMVLCDATLTAHARARSARIADELPTVLEFLALCLAAGEGILDSLRRVGGAGSGELTAELREVVLDVGTGVSLPDALAAMSRRMRVPGLSRAVEHIVAALDRGAPLAQALQAQASDAREEAKRTLIETAGRKEILMLLPLVFGLLPLSVVFAVFPGVFMLRLGIG